MGNATMKKHFGAFTKVKGITGAAAIKYQYFLKKIYIYSIYSIIYSDFPIMIWKFTILQTRKVVQTA